MPYYNYPGYIEDPHAGGRAVGCRTPTHAIYKNVNLYFGPRRPRELWPNFRIGKLFVSVRRKYECLRQQGGGLKLFNSYILVWWSRLHAPTQSLNVQVSATVPLPLPCPPTINAADSEHHISAMSYEQVYPVLYSRPVDTKRDIPERQYVCRTRLIRESCTILPRRPGMRTVFGST